MTDMPYLCRRCGTRYSEPGECDWCYGQARMTRLPLDDLVARLRADAAMNLELPEVSHLQRSGALELEAADEIQRLLAERDRYYNERNECRALLSHVDSNAYAEALAKHKSLPWQSP